MNRRQFAFSALATIPLSFETTFDDVVRDSPFVRELQRLFSEPQHAAEVGRRYLRAYPEKLDRRALIDDLLPANASRGASPISLRHLVSQWQERDFRDGNVVTLDGWILARTEVSLCALLWLNARA